MHAAKMDAPSISSALKAWPAANQQYIFLLSHMRSYSSLLAHVLGNSSDIDGYGETHVRYRNKLDLWRLRRRIQQSTGAPLRGRWLLDKILHNYIRAPDRLIADTGVRAIIFLRRPEAAMRSILTLARANPEEKAMRDPQLVCDYYVSRLHRLRLDGERFGSRALYFDAEALIDHPHEILAGLGDWLELRQPLALDYKLLPRSGETGFGDPSHNIYAGKILDASASTIAADIDLPNSMLIEAEAAYQRCRTALLNCCRGLRTGRDRWL